MKISIREAIENDKNGWQNLYRQYAEFYKVPMPEETLETVWSWIQNENEAFYSLVAHGEIAHGERGTVIGFMNFRAMHSPLRGSKVGFLDDLFVAPEWRGKGVVNELFKALDLQARNHKWQLIRWITADDNLRAQACYDKLSERTNWVTYQLNID